MSTQTTDEIVNDLADYVATIFEPDDVVELRCIGPGKPQQRWCLASEVESNRGWLQVLNDQKLNIYIGANPRSAKGATGDANIAIARTMFADFDHTTVPAALERIKAASLVDATLVINSGHGCHAYWRFDEPFNDLDVWTERMKDLIALVGSDKAIHNPERIMRVPGFRNWKEPAADCSIVECRDTHYGWADFMASLPKRKGPNGEWTREWRIDGKAEQDSPHAEAVSNAIGNGQRNSTLASLAGTMRRRGMSEGAILAALRSENTTKCKPPLDDDEVRQIAASVSRYRPDETSEATENVQPTFTFHAATEFDALDLRRDYHIRGILAAGGVPTVLAGSFKTLKTSIAADLLISLATNSSFLGHFHTSKRIRVAMMSGESGGFALQSLIRRIVRQKGWVVSGIEDYLHICTAAPNLGAKADLAFIEKFIVENEIKVFTIDPAYLAMRGLGNDDAGSIFAMGRFLEPLAKIGERTGCTPIIVHHNSRGATRANVGEPAELADIAWSGFAEWAGQWLLLARRERFNPDSDGEHRLWLSAGGRDGHSALVGVNVTEGRSDDPGGRRWDVTVDRASSIRSDAVASQQEQREQDRQTRLAKQLEIDQAAIVAAMTKLPEGDTKSAIRDRTAIRTERFAGAFAELLAKGTIEPCEIAKGNGQKYEGYKLHSDALGRTRTQSEQSRRPGAVCTHSDIPPIGGVPCALVPMASPDACNNDGGPSANRPSAMEAGL